jgi:hypothetical protein
MRKLNEKARVVRDEEEGEEESAVEGAFQLDMSDEQATTLHDILPDAQRSKVKHDKKLKDLVKNLNSRVFITPETLPANTRFQTQCFHNAERFEKFLKDNNLGIGNLKILNAIELIAVERAPYWENVWLTLVSTELAMFLKLRIHACYPSFDHKYQCLIAYFITNMLHRDRE